MPHNRLNPWVLKQNQSPRKDIFLPLYRLKPVYPQPFSKPKFENITQEGPRTENFKLFVTRLVLIIQKLGLGHCGGFISQSGFKWKLPYLSVDFKQGIITIALGLYPVSSTWQILTDLYLINTYEKVPVSGKSKINKDPWRFWVNSSSVFVNTVRKVLFTEFVKNTFETWYLSQGWCCFILSLWVRQTRSDYESKLHTCSDSMNLKANKKFNFLSRALTKQNCSAVRGVLTKLNVNNRIAVSSTTQI